ncbi:MAG TPA: hypothetical protein VFO65_06025 [Acidimicrobiales bacterium]|nr:hypothetical protein [Acidimicrobiales bacterium]
MVAVVLVFLVVVAAVIAFLVAGGDDGDDDDGSPGTANPASSLSRYCDLALQVDGLLAEAGTAEDPAAALGQVMPQLGPTAAELESTAPGDVRADVNALLAALRQAAEGDASAAQAPAFQDHRQRILDYGQANCPAGAGQGEG